MKKLYQSLTLAKTKGQNYAFQGHAETLVVHLLFKLENTQTKMTCVLCVQHIPCGQIKPDKIHALKPYIFMPLILKCKTAINVGYARLIETLFMHALIIK